MIQKLVNSLQKLVALIDVPDVLMVLGLALGGMAVFLIAGWAGVLSFGAAICLVASVALASRGKHGG